MAVAAALGAAPLEPAVAGDCSLGGCVDAARLPATAGADLGDIIRRAQRFYSVDAKVYIVSSDQQKAYLPYMLPKQEPYVLVDQIHIPEIYHILTESGHEGPHYVWHYIIGHEMAHAYQNRIKIIEAMAGPFNSVVLAELHADYMAGFFMASEFGLNVAIIDGVLRELKALPSGPPGSPSYHGEIGERFFMVTQGALNAFRSPRPSREEASGRGVRCAFDLITGRNKARTLSDICN